MSTIVSAFISNVNSRIDRDIIKYYEHGKILFKSTTPKIIFIDKNMSSLIKETDYNKDNTIFIEIKKDNCYLYQYLDLLNNFNLNTDNPNKDTLEFIFTMCNKTEWIKEAIQLNHFKTDNFIWIDFGIKHVLKCHDDQIINKLNNLSNKVYSKIRIGTIWNLNNTYNIDIYRDISWYFAGGVFGGNSQTLIHFANSMKEYCIYIIKTKNTIMWEVNIWYLIYLNNRDSFDTYSCDHNNSIIDNY